MHVFDSFGLLHRSLRLGDPSAFLPILNFVLLEYSPLVSLDLKKHGFEVRTHCFILFASCVDCENFPAYWGMQVQLRGKTDARFIEAAFRVFREYFRIKLVLSPHQFLEQVRTPTICKRLNRHELRKILWVNETPSTSAGVCCGAESASSARDRQGLQEKT